MLHPWTADLAIYRLIQTQKHTLLHDIRQTISLLRTRTSITEVLLFLNGHSDLTVRKVGCSETMWILIMDLRVLSQPHISARCSLANRLRLPRQSQNFHRDPRLLYRAIDTSTPRQRLPSTRTRQTRLLLDNTIHVLDLIRLHDLRGLLRRFRNRQGLVPRRLFRAKPRVSLQR